MTRAQSKDSTEPNSFSSLFNLPYSNEVQCFSQARHIAHPTTLSKVINLLFQNVGHFLVLGKYMIENCPFLHLMNGVSQESSQKDLSVFFRLYVYYL